MSSKAVSAATARGARKPAGMVATARARRAPVTPGQLLWHDFMEPIGLTKYRLAKEIGVPPQRIGAIINGKRSISADTCLRLCRYFGLSEGYWLRCQNLHDLEKARREIADELEAIVPRPVPKFDFSEDDDDD